MSHINLQNPRVYNPFFTGKMELGVSKLAIAGALTITAEHPPLLWIDPTGAQNVTMPAPTAGKGMFFVLVHGSTNNADLTVKNSAAVTIGTLSQNEIGFVVGDGVNTFFGVAKQT